MEYVLKDIALVAGCGLFLYLLKYHPKLASLFLISIYIVRGIMLIKGKKE